MRAVCEKCGAAQPPDWKAGDLCGACGAAVRRDVRCFWCAKWTPFAKFCRSCGAETVEETLYGAARMLKDAGTDRFSVPKLLRELPADQIENFTRIYQRHAAAVARHVDDLRFLERFLFHKTWSEQLEDELIPQLPLGEAALKGLSLPPLAAGDDLQTVKAIHASTPLPRTKALAALALIRLDDWDAVKEASKALYDKQLCPEAALVLTGWRLHAAGRVFYDDHIPGWLEASPFRLEAGVRLGLLGKGDPDLLREALDAQDPETAFTAALAVGDAGRLAAALGGDELQKVAAGKRLAELGHFAQIEQTVGRSSLEVQVEILQSLLRQKRPVPELRAALFHIVDRMRFEDEALVRKLTFVGDDHLRWKVRGMALRLLCRACPPADALRIAQAAMGEREIFRSLLVDEAALPPDSVGEVLAHMVEIGKFSHDHYGLSDALKRGAVPAAFAIDQFPRATPEMRSELARLAEDQLKQHDDEALRRFLLNAVFGPYPARTRAAAWWALHRASKDNDPEPFRLEKAAIERHFGSIRDFFPKLASVLRDAATMKEVGVYEFIAKLFSSADPASLPAFFAEETAAHELLQAILESLRGDYWAYTIDGMIQFVGLLGTHPRWRDEAIAGIEALGKRGNYHWEKTLRTLRLSAHGLPDESEWSKLPDDFVPSRFEAAAPATRLQLLRVADEQLIHRKPESVARFLLDVALGPYDPPLRIEALRLFDDRAPRELGHPTMSPALLPKVTSILREPLLRKDRKFLDLLHDLLRNFKGPADEAFALALLEVAADQGEGGSYYNLRMDAVRLLGHVGGESVIPGLRKLRDTKGFDLVSECERALEKLAPPMPEPPPPPGPESVSAPPPPLANPWIAKQEEAQRLGRELQEAAMRISFGPGSPEEKTREIMRLQEAFQAKIKSLYGA